MSIGFRSIFIFSIFLMCFQEAAFSQENEAEKIKVELNKAKALILQLEQRLQSLESSSREEVAGAREGKSDVPSVEVIEVETPISSKNLTAAPKSAENHPSLFTSSANLSAGSDGSQASISLSRTKLYPGPWENGFVIIGDGGSIPSRNAGSGLRGLGSQGITESITRLTFSAPLGKKGDTPFATLDGLAAGTKLELSFLNFNTKVYQGIVSDPIIRRAKDECKSRTTNKYSDCDRIDQNFMDEFLSEPDKRKLEKLYSQNSLFGSGGLKYSTSVGYEEFEYYPLPTLSKKTADRFSFGASVGVITFPNPRTSVSFDGEYQTTFTAADTMTTCLPDLVANATTLTCATGSLTKPESTEKLILSPEVRRLLFTDLGVIASIGVAPKFQYDVLSDDFAFDLPVYFVTDGKDGLTGGIRVGFEDKNDKDGFKFGVFIGKPFSIFSQ